MSDQLGYIPGRYPDKPGPLARFLPPVPDGLARGWLSQVLPAGSWVLEPFGASPQLAIEAARSGYRVLAAVNNPIARFLFEFNANPPTESVMRSALAELAASRKGDERLEPHIRSIYETDCDRCSKKITAESFVWDKDIQAPISRIYHCPYCGDNGERPTGTADARRAARFISGGLHQARALERVTPINDPDRAYVEAALETYPPRAIYSLFTLINKLRSLSPVHLPHLVALLLTALDQANTLWKYPTARERPRQLTVPPQYLEKNVWLALEEAVPKWSSSLQDERDQTVKLPFTIWPDLPPRSGGISLFEGRMKDLARQLSQGQEPGLSIGAVLTALPRPNQAFWTLSALWSGWLWGHDAVEPFKSVLRRRRYDWAWHTTALNAVFQHMSGILDVGAPLFGVIGELEPGFLAAALLAADMAGYALGDVALRADHSQAQVFWRIVEKNALVTKKSASEEFLHESGIKAACAHLCRRGEPASFTHMHAAILTQFVQAETLAAVGDLPPGEVLSKTQVTIQDILARRDIFARYGESDRTPESGSWWLPQERLVSLCSDPALPLADRLEMGVVRFLVAHPGCHRIEIDRAVCKDLPGLLTPDWTLVEACIQSYGKETPPESGQWQLRAQDAPQARNKDLDEMRSLLVQVGEHLGYTIPLPSAKATRPAARLQPVLWRQPGGGVAYVFYTLASGVFGKVLFDPQAHKPSPSGEPIQYYIVIPGSRAGLVHSKMTRNPHLREALDRGWNFLKYRLLRRLAENQLLTRENLDEHLASDPLASADPQIALL